MVSDAALIPVANEEQAWQALRGILDGTIDPETSQLDFSAADWVNFHVNYKGPKLQRTLTPSLMLGIVEYQRSLYRAIALVTKGDPRITKLTDDEKDVSDKEAPSGAGASEGSISDM